MGLIYVFLALVPALAVCEDTTPIPDRKVCYTDLGCFENKAPFDNAQGRVPKSPEQIGTVFRLFTRLNRTDGQDLLYNDSTSFASSDFNSSNPTKFIVHGFGGRLSNKWMVAIKDALLDTVSYYA
ncbi:inactive pancreatic lipase-related protein 1-like [Aplysia californica]|uniref:Inactive pancreatic lipase-related protein 1-like n=1 Tax=Aplysia californica TaxID=6500 RepID=A0ABM1VXY6_APLCA|nr:inactive pancreatic lipase-related protein 1-like [Aplysia californica]